VTLLAVDTLSKRYGGVKAVDACSFNVAEGSITGLIGPNGSGKTTVFNLITGVVARDQGMVRFHDRDITGLAADRIFGLGIGRTFQLPRIFARLTVLENMLVPVRRSGLIALLRHATAREERERAMALLAFMRIEELASAAAGTLSYGQRKLLELAAVMMAKPELVLLDEPAGGVNPALLERIGERIRELNTQGCSFLIVEHNMSFVMGLCDAVVVLSRGQRIAEGPPHEVRVNPVVLDAYLGD
jgi:neutral amino acid transport system ATP-binding protein